PKSLYRVQSPVVIHTGGGKLHQEPQLPWGRLTEAWLPFSAYGPSDHHQHSFIRCNACLYDGGGNRSTRSKPTQARGEHANSTQKGPGTTWNDQYSNPGPSCCEATVLTTEPPCCLAWQPPPSVCECVDV